MKKLILHGVRNIALRRRVELFLDSGYEIIGYTDTYYTHDTLDGKPFISPKHVPKMEFDYILLLSTNENNLKAMKSDWIGQGVPPEKILFPMMLLAQEDGSGAPYVDLIGDIEAQYRGEEGLIFGMSYSCLGILGKKLRPAFFDCSWISLDLYYNYRILQYMRRRGLLTGVRTALLAFPYNFFNYDMSRAIYAYQYSYIFAIRKLNDWHNFQQVPVASDYIANYKMFGRKVSEFYHVHKFESQIHSIYQGEDGATKLIGRWCRNHPATIAENTALFSDFCRELSEMGISPVLLVPPYYVKGISPTSMELVREKKEQFYQIAGAAGMDIFDFFDVFADRRELFYDPIHLNSDGAEAFTELINQTVLQNQKYRERFGSGT